MNRKDFYQIKEYDYLYTANDNKGQGFGDGTSRNIALSKENFEAIERFVLQNKKLEDEDEVSEFLTISSKKGIGRILKAKNYVGLLQTKDGTSIEILPKIFFTNDEGDEDISITKSIFLKMLGSLKNTPFKKFSMANVNSDKISLFNIFIDMFLDELSILLKIGLKSDYILVEANSKFLRGKLKVSDNIKRNIAHTEYFYIEYHDYIRNNPENRILKTTLHYLSRKTSSSRIQQRIRVYLSYFDDIEVSRNINSDFAILKDNRLMKDYGLILKWCRVFLNQESFTSYSGEHIAYSLLFPMDRVFQDYVADSIWKSSIMDDFTDMDVQENEYHLVSTPQKFRLKPDIVLRKKNEIVILDTKWKELINDPRKNYGISQADMYQMYAYGMKYNEKGENVKKIFLLYPQNNNFKDEEQDELLRKMNFKYNDNLSAQIFFVDLQRISESMKSLLKLIKGYQKESII